MRTLHHIISQPLGEWTAFAPSRKEIAFTAISTAVGLGASLLGGYKASKAARKAERRQRQQEASEDAWYNRRYYEDYLDAAPGQNLVRRAKEYAKETVRNSTGTKAVAGGTDAATQMAKDAGNKMVGDTISNIAATDQGRKAQVDDMHRRAEQNFAQMDMNREMQRAQNITNAAQGASNAIMSAAVALEQSNEAKTNLQGGNNNGTPVEKGQVYTDAPAPSRSTEVFGGDNALNKVSQGATEDEILAARRVIGGM